MTNPMKWVLIAGALLVCIAFVWTERDRGRYIESPSGILDTRTGTIYSGENLKPQEIGRAEPYWNRKALTAKFDKAECQDDKWSEYAEPPATLPADWFDQNGIKKAVKARTYSAEDIAAPDQPAPLHVVQSEHLPCYLGLRFLLKNNTPEDLQIHHGNIIWPWAADSGAFDRTGVHGARVREDVSVPAGLSAPLQVLTDDRCEAHAKNWDACLKQDFANTGPLVLFVRGTRYEIELPLR